MKYFFLFPLLAINMIYILYVCQAAVRKHMHGDLIQCFSWKFTDINSGMSRSLFYRDENVRDRAASNCIESQKSHFIYPYAYSRSIIVSVCVPCSLFCRCFPISNGLKVFSFCHICTIVVCIVIVTGISHQFNGLRLCLASNANSHARKNVFLL